MGKRTLKFPETERFQQLVLLTSQTEKFQDERLINPTELATEIGTSPSWAARALMALGWSGDWKIGSVRSPRKYYCKEEEW